MNDSMQAFVAGLPLLVQVAMLIAAADLVQYSVHRAFHEIPGLWSARTSSRS